MYDVVGYSLNDTKLLCGDALGSTTTQQAESGILTNELGVAPQAITPHNLNNFLENEDWNKVITTCDGGEVSGRICSEYSCYASPDQDVTGAPTMKIAGVCINDIGVPIGVPCSNIYEEGECQPTEVPILDEYLSSTVTTDTIELVDEAGGPEWGLHDSTNDKFLSTSVSGTPITLIPIYEYYRSSINDHRYSRSSTAPSGYDFVSTAFYAVPPNSYDDGWGGIYDNEKEQKI